MKSFKKYIFLNVRRTSEDEWPELNFFSFLACSMFVFQRWQGVKGQWGEECANTARHGCTNTDSAFAQIQIMRLHIYEYVVCANTAYLLPSSTTMRCFLCLFYQEKTNKFVKTPNSHLNNASLSFCKSGTPILQKGSLRIFRTAVLWIINEQLSMPAADIVHSAQIFYHRHCSAELRIWIFRGCC